MEFDNIVLPNRNELVSVSPGHVVLIVRPNNDYAQLEHAVDMVENAEYTTIIIGAEYLLDTLAAMAGRGVAVVEVGVPNDGDNRCLRLRVGDQVAYIAQRKTNE